MNVYGRGIKYKSEKDPTDKTRHVARTLTDQGCTAADCIVGDVRQKGVRIEGPEAVDLRLVFEPTWTQDMMSEEAKLELGFL